MSGTPTKRENRSNNYTMTDSITRPTSPSSVLIYGTLFIVQLVFVLWMFIAKFTMSRFNISPIVFAAYREVLATLVLVATVATGCMKRNNDVAVTKSDIKKHSLTFLFLGFLCFCHVACYISALDRVPSFNAAVFSTTQPIFATVIAYLCGYENMTMLKALSVTMTCLGAVLTVWLSYVVEKSSVLVETDPSNLNLGNALLLVSFFASGSMWVAQKQLLIEIPSPITVTAVTYAVASALTVTVALVLTPLRDFYIVSPTAWAAIGYAVFFATVFTYCAMAWANKWANPSTVTLSLGLQPLLTALVNTLTGGPAFIPPHMLSCGLIVAGLGAKVYDQEKKKKEDEDEESQNLETKQPLVQRP